MKPKIPYALYQGRLIDVHHPKVRRGYNKDCICPDKNCQQELSARKGEKNRHHFYHQRKNNCTGLETSLHLKAKETIEGLSEMMIPGFEVPTEILFECFKDDLMQMDKLHGANLYSQKFINLLEEKLNRERNYYLLFGPQNILLKDYTVELEYYMDNLVPDIKLTQKNTGRSFYIEIGVTSLINKKKKEIIADKGLFVLEYDLSKFYRSKFYSEEEKFLEKTLEAFLHDYMDYSSLYYEIFNRLKAGWINIPNLYNRVQKSEDLKTQFLEDVRKFYELYNDIKILLDRWGRGGYYHFSIHDMGYLDNYKKYKDWIQIRDHELISYFRDTLSD